MSVIGVSLVVIKQHLVFSAGHILSIKINLLYFVVIPVRESVTSSYFMAPTVKVNYSLRKMKVYLQLRF